LGSASACRNRPAEIPRGITAPTRDDRELQRHLARPYRTRVEGNRARILPQQIRQVRIADRIRNARRRSIRRSIDGAPNASNSPTISRWRCATAHTSGDISTVRPRPVITLR
jgi:hypothetical protein